MIPIPRPVAAVLGTALFLLLLCALPCPALAETAAPGVPPEAAALAEKIFADCDQLIRVIESRGPLLNAEHKYARDRFIGLQRAAAEFRNRPPKTPVGPQPEELHDMREAYGSAERYFDTIQRNPEAKTVILNLTAEMRALRRMYGLEGPITQDDMNQIANNVQLIVDYSEQLASAAREELATGRVSPADMSTIERVAESAHRLQSALQAAGPDPFQAAPAYNELMDRMMDARTVLARFTMNTQGDYGLLWNVTQSLSDLAPQSATSGFPYESRPLIKRH